MNKLYSRTNNFIFFLINFFIDFFIYLKYFVYFNLFLFSLISNLIYYKINNNINTRLIKSLYYSINLNGCVLIKFVQWVIINIELLEDDNNHYILNMFKKFYENCSIHNLNYTKKMFYKDFGYKFDEILIIDEDFSVKSGSIAQVYKVKLNTNNIENEFNFLQNEINNSINNEKTYALKVVHPEVYYQLFFPISFINSYKFLVSNIGFLKNYDTIFDFNSFFHNLKLQLNMNNEYKNMQYFYKTYIDNPYIVIPEPIVSSENCLLMEYVDGEFMENMAISDFEKQKISSLLNLFNKDCFFLNDYFHSDLHDSNWKVKKYKDFYQLVIYDFGYIIKNNIKELSKKTILNFDLNNLEGIGESIYESCISNTNINKEFIVNDYKKYMIKTVPYTDDYLVKTYQFCYKKKLILKPAFLELFISNILLKKYFQKYLFKHISDPYDSNFLIKLNLNYIHVCKQYNIFKEVQTYMENAYLNNQTLLNSYLYEDNYLKNIEIENKNENVLEEISI
jgi:predicted unusual protein kinase regulating ubiquinone biosynthesis (AarF/ABC1/UbiB family)